MKLLWHLAAKDLRHLWLPITLFAALIAAKLLVGVMLWRHTGPFDPEWFGRLEKYVLLAQVMEALVGFVLVAAIVQTDSLIGTRAFWMTRPISGGQLLLAKALTMLLVFVLMPLVLTLPWWLSCGFNLGEIAEAAKNTMLPHLIVVLLAWPLAALTGSFQRFVLWSVFGVVLVLVVTLYSAAGMIPTQPNLSPVVLTAWLMVAMRLAPLGIIAVLIHQYRTRRLARSVGMGILALVVVITAPLLIPGAWRRQAPQKTTTGSSLVDGVKIDDARIAYAAPKTRRADTRLVLTLQVSGRAKGCLLGGSMAQVQFTEANSPGLKTRWPLHELYLTPTAPQPSLALRTLQAKRYGITDDTANPSDASAPAMEFISEIYGPEDAANSYRTTAPRLAIDAQFDLFRLEPRSESSWQTGSTLVNGSLQVRIADALLDQRERMILAVIRRYPAPNFTSSFEQRIGFTRQPSVLALVNRAQGNVSLSSIGGSPAIWIAGVAIGWSIETYWPHMSWDTEKKEKMVSDADWFDGAKLVLLGTRKVETFTRHFEVSALAIGPESASPVAPKR